MPLGKAVSEHRLGSGPGHPHPAPSAPDLFPQSFQNPVYDCVTPEQPMAKPATRSQQPLHHTASVLVSSQALCLSAGIRPSCFPSLLPEALFPLTFKQAADSSASFRLCHVHAALPKALLWRAQSPAKLFLGRLGKGRGKRAQASPNIQLSVSAPISLCRAPALPARIQTVMTSSLGCRPELQCSPTTAEQSRWGGCGSTHPYLQPSHSSRRKRVLQQHPPQQLQLVNTQQPL